MRDFRNSGPLKNGTQLFRYIQLTRNPAPLKPEIKMQVDARYRLQPRFKNGPPAYGERVIDTLRLLWGQVSATLTDFAPHLA
jgi:hypothetical protein